MIKPIMFYEKVNNYTLNMLLKCKYSFIPSNMSKYDFMT